MKKNRLSALLVILVSSVIIFPVILLAGGDFQQKIQGKINASKNIQYNLDAAQQLEPYYFSSSQQQTLAGKEELRRQAQVVDEKSALIGAPSISQYAIYKTSYNAEIEEDVVTVKGNVLFEVFKKGWTQIPLVRSSVGLIDVGVNRGAAFVTMQGGRYYLMIDKPGRYNLDIEFLIKASRERENGPGNFSFELIPAPISQFEFTMAESGVEIFVEPAIKIELKREPKKTIAWAVMPNTNNITVRWSKALPKETITPVKLEPKVYVDTATYASIGEGLIRCRSSFNYSILQSEISNLRIVLPEDVSVLEVKGDNLRDWKVSKEDDLQYLDVYLNFGTKGNYALNLTYERKVGDGSAVVQIPQVKALGVERETGFFGLAAATNVELAVNKIEHVTLVDVKELPSSIWGMTANPILLAFKYLSHPFSIAIDVTKHEELPVLMAAIDSAKYTTLHTDEGKSLTKAIYQVRNNVKQFIHLVLPSNANLWSVFVSGKPVKPAKDKNGNILIPLEKSQLSGETLTQFPVEIVYLDMNSKMGPLGILKLNLPKTDIPVSSLSWYVYLPLDYVYFNFGGDVKQSKEERIRRFELGGFTGGVQQIQSNLKVSEKLERQYSPSVVYKELKSDMMKGVLPIKIDIPEQGRPYFFSKLLVTEKESPCLSVNFITVFKPMHGLLKFLIWVIVLFFAAKVIKKSFFRKKIATEDTK